MEGLERGMRGGSGAAGASEGAAEIRSFVPEIETELKGVYNN